MYAKEGAKVVVVDYNEQTAQDTVTAIHEHGGQAIAVKADVSNETDVKNVIQTAISEFLVKLISYSIMRVFTRQIQ